MKYVTDGIVMSFDVMACCAVFSSALCVFCLCGTLLMSCIVGLCHACDVSAYPGIHLITMPKATY